MVPLNALAAAPQLKVVLLKPVGVAPVMLFLTGQLESVVKSIMSMSLPVLELHTQRILCLACHLVRGFVAQPVFQSRVTKTLRKKAVAMATFILCAFLVFHFV